jgi:hypothetical protein
MSTRWRPIASAPRDGRRVLILEENDGEGFVDIARFTGEIDTAHQWVSDAGICYVPKLWMPLPSVKNGNESSPPRD